MYCRYNDACYVGDKLYASACNMNGLFSIDIKTHEVNYIASFPKDSRLCYDLHSKVINKGNTLFFIPLNGTGISIVHLPDYSFEFIDSKVKYVNALLYKDSIYLIPYQLSDGIWEFLIEDNILVKTNINIFEKKLFTENNMVTDWYGSVIVDDELYVVISGTGSIAIVSLITGESKWIQYEGVQFANITYSKGWFYITDNQYSYIYRMKMQKDELLKLEIPGEKTRTIYRVLEYNNYIICIPCFGNIIYKYNPINNNFYVLYAIQENKHIDNHQTKYAGTVMVDKKIFLLPKGDLRIIELDIESLSSYELCFNDFLKSSNKYNTSIIYEDRSLELPDYLQIL